MCVVETSEDNWETEVVLEHGVYENNKDDSYAVEMFRNILKTNCRI